MVTELKSVLFQKNPKLDVGFSCIAPTNLACRLACYPDSQQPLPEPVHFPHYCQVAYKHKHMCLQLHRLLVRSIDHQLRSAYGTQASPDLTPFPALPWPGSFTDPLKVHATFCVAITGTSLGTFVQVSPSVRGQMSRELIL